MLVVHLRIHSKSKNWCKAGRLTCTDTVFLCLLHRVSITLPETAIRESTSDTGALEKLF